MPISNGVDEQNNIQPQKARWLSHWAVKVFLGVLLAGGLVLLGWGLRGNDSDKSANLPSNTDTPINVVHDPKDLLPLGTSSPEVLNPGGEKPEEWLAVDWYKTPKERPCSGEYFEGCMIVGKILSGEYKNRELFLEIEQGLGSTLHYYPILEDGSLGLDMAEYVSPVSYLFKGVHDAPETIALPNTGYILKKAYRTALFSSQKIQIKLFDHPVLGAMYLMDNGCIMVKMPDQTALAYDIQLPFANQADSKIIFTLNSGQPNNEDYQFNKIMGCVALCYYLAVVPDSELKPQERLKPAGKIANGEEIFELLNPNDSKLKDLYNDQNTVAYYSEGYENTGKNKYTYQEFLAFKPLLYWKDPIGRWIEFKNTRFMPAAEMCKPVIYLYPTLPTELTVKVFPNGGFTYTNPAYNNGWKVMADPSGKIVDLSTGQEYPYLFWEGIGLNYPISEDGWVVAKKDMVVFLEQVLPKVGLEGQEKKDFMEYWVGRLSEHPYYRLNFLKQEQFNEIAPLEFVGQAPDSFIRVLMTARGLEKPEKSIPQDLPKPQSRHGFTLVEWGGVVLK